MEQRDNTGQSSGFHGFCQSRVPPRQQIHNDCGQLGRGAGKVDYANEACRHLDTAQRTRQSNV